MPRQRPNRIEQRPNMFNGAIDHANALNSRFAIKKVGYRDVRRHQNPTAVGRAGGSKDLICNTGRPRRIGCVA